MNNWFIATLPAFPGFYDSFLYDPDMENAAAVENAEAIPDRYLFPADILNSLFWMYDKAYTFDFEGYKKAAASAYADEVAEVLAGALYRCPVVYSGVEIRVNDVISPREYNFTTDRVEIEIRVDSDDVIHYLKSNRAAWEKYRVEKFTSRDGFISFYSPDDPAFNNPEAWIDDENGVYLSAALEFIVYNELGDDAEYFLSERALSNCNMSEFITIDPALEDFLSGEGGAAIAADFERLSYQGRRYVEIMGDKYQDEARAGIERVTRELAADIIAALNTTDIGCNIA